MDIFGKVAVASTFSPRFLPMLAEAKAIATLLDRPLEIIHAGPEIAESQERFSQAFTEMGFSAPVHWREASQPSAAISDRQAKAQPCFMPPTMKGRAAGSSTASQVWRPREPMVRAARA